MNGNVSNELYGRRQIFTAAEEITEDNVIQVLADALTDHAANISEEDYLYWYRRGKTPIMGRTKEVRPEINNKVSVNNANMVCVFKNGYFLPKSAFYTARSDDESIVAKVQQLNEYLYTSGKTVVDNKTVNWFDTVGLAAVMVEPNNGLDKTERPVLVHSLDPRSAFCVYSMRPGNRPVMGVNVVISGSSAFVDVFTENFLFRISGGMDANGTTAGDSARLSVDNLTVNAVEPNVLGLIPIIEYQYNENRMSCFEPGICIMDEIESVYSNLADAISQEVQQLCVAYNCQFEEGTTANSIREAGMLLLKSTNENKADFKILTQTLNQSETHVTLSDLYDQMLEKCGVPSSIRDGGSTSDNVGAVYLRSGWAMADTDARNTEDLFKESNRRFDEVFLRILYKANGFDLSINDFELCFPRNDTNNLLVRTQAALNLKQLGFSPELAFERSGLSNDPIGDVEQSRKYIDSVWGVQEGSNAPAADTDQEEPTEEPAAVTIEESAGL